MTRTASVGARARSRARNTRITPDMAAHAAEAAGLLKAMANEQRLLILCHLLGTRLSVSELNERIPLSQSALSQHLAILREARLVDTQRRAQAVYYSLPEGAVSQVMQVLERIFCRPARRTL